MAEIKSIGYCIFCKEELSKSKKKLFCAEPTCRKTHKFQVSLEARPGDVERDYWHNMIYCYNCGEKLNRNDKGIMCVDGCEEVTVDCTVMAERDREHTAGSTSAKRGQAQQLTGEQEQDLERSFNYEDVQLHCNSQPPNETVQPPNETVQPPNEMVLQQLADKLSPKWKLLAKELKVPQENVDTNSTLTPQECYMAIINTWKRNKTVPYTWNEFLKVLESIDEKAIAHEIIDSYGGNKNIGNSVRVSELFLFSGSNWVCPDILIADCKYRVNFHVVLDLSVWGFNSDDDFNLSISSLEINNSLEYFGNFQCCYRHGMLRLYHCQLPIPIQFLWKEERVFRYKYVIRKKQMANIQVPIPKYETLSMYSVKGSRCVDVVGSVQAQFDAEIRPKEKGHGWFTLAPKHDVSIKALPLYMDWAISEMRWTYVESNELEKEIDRKAKLLALIADNLQKSTFILKKSEKQSVVWKENLITIESFNKVLLKLLAEFVSSLSGIEKFLSCLIVTCTFYVINIFFHASKAFIDDIESTVALVRGLHIPPTEYTKCVQILSQFSQQFKEQNIAHVAIKLCYILKDSSRSFYEWLGVLPLLHVTTLNKFVPREPYQLVPNARESDDGIYQTLFCGLQSNTTIKKSNKYTFNTSAALELIEPYFEHDWLMPRAFITVCPYANLSSCIISKGMASCACWRLSLDMKLNNDHKELSETLVTLNSMLSELQEEEWDLCYIGVDKMLHALPYNGVHSHNVLKSLTQITLTLLDQPYVEKRNIYKATAVILCNRIQNWMRNIDQIIVHDEIMKWSEFFSLKVKNVLLSETWSGELLQKFCSRLKEVKLKSLLPVVASEHLQPFIKNKLLETISHLIKELQPEERAEIIRQLKTKTEQQQKVLSAIISYLYPGDESVPFQSLFNSYWILIFEIYGNVNTDGGMLDEASAAVKICEQAEDEMSNFFEKLSKKQITPHDLDNVLSAGKPDSICEIVKSFLSLKLFDQQYSLNICELEILLKSYDSFKKRNKKLVHFVHKFHDLAKADAKKIDDILQSNYTKIPVSDLWETESDPLQFKFCPMAIPDIIIDNVYKLTNSDEEKVSKVFENAFVQKRQNYMPRDDATLRTAVEEFWEPLYTAFKSDLENLRDGLKLPLSKVDCFFNNISGDQVKLELERWCETFAITNEWVSDASQKILDYQELCKHSDTAKTLNKLKEKLQLTGDFSAVEALGELQKSAKMTLATIEKTAAKTAGILKDIAEGSHRRACLEKFCDSMELVELVKSMSKNINQLQNVIQIANQTMEGDIFKQLLQDLLIFGRAFAPLIYEVDKSEGCNALINRCKSLWVFLADYPNLIKITMSCNDQLKELNQVRESLSDFQRNSVQQMISINQHGVYTIEPPNSECIIHSIDDDKVVCLKVTNTETKDERVLSLAELRELQNKLVLVSTENADDVQRFIEILSKIERIALLLVKLQEAGCVKYTQFCLKWECSEYKSESFNAVILLMEEELEDWKRRVEEYRKQYPHLNYYSSQQLFDLRFELGQLKKNSDFKTSRKIKQLLLFVNPHPQQQKITEALCNFNASQAIPAVVESKSIQKESVADCSEFSEKKKAICNKLVEEYEFKEIVVCTAFSTFSEDAGIEEIRQWCLDHEHEYTDENIPTLMIACADEDYDVSEDDPLVQELVNDEDYELSVALEAVKKARGDRQRAREIASDVSAGISDSTTFDGDESSTTNSFARIAKCNNDFLCCEELGQVLMELSHENEYICSEVSRGRSIELFLIDRVFIWKTVLSLYMINKQPLPTLDQIVICTETTSVEEITLLWHRAINDTQKRLFCLLNADKLPFDISEEVTKNLKIITHGIDDFNIAILISKKHQTSSNIVSQLSQCLKKLPQLPTDDDIAQYVYSSMEAAMRFTDLSSDQERDVALSLSKSVHVVTSSRPGMGKTLRIKRMAEMVDKIKTTDRHSYVYIPIYGPDISLEHILKLMKDCQQDPTDPYPQLIHFNIAQDMVEKVDWLLFKILLLGGLNDSYGNIWRRSKHQICVAECTLCENKSLDKGFSSLLSCLPQTHCVSPKEVLKYYQSTMKQKNIALVDELVYEEDAVKRVYQCLKERYSTYSNISTDNSIQEYLECILQCIILNDSAQDPSWVEITNFVQFLNAQLLDCDKSMYCTLGEPMGFKEFVIKFAIRMSKEFTQSSVEPNSSNAVPTISKEKDYNACPHPYLFFDPSGSSIVFLGLWVNVAGHLIDYRTKKIIERKIMSKELRKWLGENGIAFDDEYDKWNKEDMVLRLMRTLAIDQTKYRKEGKTNTIDLEKIDPDNSYILTIDNIMKMLAIHMKFRCGIPVVMMGETGCGKTRLLRYFCELQDKVYGVKTLICLKVHGGFTEEHIYNEVKSAIDKAKENKDNSKCFYTVLFFDEVNTTEALGLIKEVMCDRTLYGEPIPDDLKFAAACNPYKIHDEETLKSLQSAGLGFYLREETKVPKLGSLPLRKLVYRVFPLPSSMYQYVYDFGSLSSDSENEYIKKIVKNQLTEYSVSNLERIHELVAKALCDCQKFMKQQKNECKYVSLRDVVRAIILFKWFHEKLCTIETLKKQLEIDCSQEEFIISRALLYSISVCYYARLTTRETFVDNIRHYFKQLDPTGQATTKFIQDEIARVQSVFLEAMRIPNNIAHNAALRENIFMMVVCIENKIPLFVVGKPGSSKSLAKSIISNSMQGRHSTNELLQNFKQVQLFPYQCNQFSTTESLIEVFKEAQKFQKSQDAANFSSVVVLEEIGLAEDAPGLPLKVLHPYLEDGTAGLNPDEMEIKPEERVAFIGISNWALDPAKMNRGIMVTRCAPEQQELIDSANGIANMVGDESLRGTLAMNFTALVTMYLNICTNQEKPSFDDDKKDECREFYGLRDFYTMIKMLCWKCLEKGAPPTPDDYRRVILRNFSGHSKINPLVELHNPGSLISMEEKEGEKLEIVQESLSPIKANERLLKQEHRYLLYITENQSALAILQNQFSTTDKILVCYGSSFPKDSEYTQLCVNINKIKVCMEKGIPVVLLNYEQIYESLYDVLNQCYTELPTGRYVDLGLRSYRIKCRVDPNFRLVIIAERDHVFKQFPTALINRLEKHFIVSESVLTKTQKDLTNNLKKWTQNFIHEGDRSLSIVDSFTGYQNDTPASIVLSVWDKFGQYKVFDESVNLILQTASVDALARLKSNSCDKTVKDKAFDTYFQEQEHFSFSNFVQTEIEKHQENGAMIQITTFGSLLSRQDYCNSLKESKIKESKIKVFHLSSFQTEIDFCSKLKNVLGKERLIIIQTEYDDTKSDLIACARHRLIDERQRISVKEITHILFIIQVPRVTGGSSFTSFQVDPWVCVHFDELTYSPIMNKIVKCALSEPFCKFFDMLIEKDAEVPKDFKICSRIKDNIQLAISKIFPRLSLDQTKETISVILNIVSDNIPKDSSITFTTCLINRIKALIWKRNDSLSGVDTWAINAALDRHQLHTNLTLVNCIKKQFNMLIQQVLTCIISGVNRNSNLNLLSSDDTCLKKMWLSLFSDEVFLPFDLDIAYSTSSTVGNSYTCQFPFSVELASQIDTIVCHRCDYSEDEKRDFADLIETINDLTFSKHFPSEHSLVYEQSLAYFQCYLHDFINNLVLPFEDKHVENIKKIINSLIHQLVITFEPAIDTGKSFPLINAIIGVHFAYHLIERKIVWLAELSVYFPEVVDIIMTRNSESTLRHTVFIYEVVEYAINQLFPSKIDWSDEKISDVIIKYHSTKNVFEAVLCFVDDANKDLYELRSKWQKFKAVVLFAQHVITQLTPDIPTNTNKLTFMKRFTNVTRDIKFCEPKLLKLTASQILNILKALPMKYRLRCGNCQLNLKVNAVVYIQCREGHMFCWNCFNNSVERRGPCCPTCDTPIPRKKEYPLPEKKKKEYQILGQVQHYCLDFFMELVSDCCFSPIAPERPSDEFVSELLSVVTNPGHPSYKGLFPFEDELEDAHSCPIARSVLLQILLTYRPKEVIIKLQEYQKFISAKFGRYNVIGGNQELILLSIKSLEDNLHKKRALQSCFKDEISLGNECLTKALNELMSGVSMKEHQDSLSVEFMQCIARVRFGMCLATDVFCQYCNVNFEENERQKLTIFQELVHDVITKGGMIGEKAGEFFVKQILRQYGFPYLGNLTQQLEWLTSNLDMSTMEDVLRQGYAEGELPKSVIWDEWKTLNFSGKSQKELSQLNQKLKGCLNDLSVVFTPKEPVIETHLADFIVHWIAVLETLPDHELVAPFKTLVLRTSEFKNNYWSLSMDDNTNAKLSPLSLCVLRILVNASCAWIASSNNKAVCLELHHITVMSTPVPLEQLLNYYWHHLEKDMKTLCRLTQHSFDDCILFLHTLISTLMTNIPTNNASIEDQQPRNDRYDWEVEIDQKIVKPNVEKGFSRARHYIIKTGTHRLADEKSLFCLGERPFIQMVYETVTITSDDIIPHLWTYRPRITVDHMALSLENETLLDLKVLREFQKQAHLLKALKYLPDIVQLQLSLRELCHENIDQTTANRSCQDFIGEGKLTKLVCSFCDAWNIVKKELLTQNIVTLPPGYILIEMTPQQSLEYFLPMKQGKGVCSIALVSYLIKLQNDFVELSWRKVKVKSCRISLQKIQFNHVISFEDQLSQVLFSHCKYSLKAGHGADIKYDFPALEKHILDKFVRGKPIIDWNMDLSMAYRSEAVVFQNIRNTIPQTPLPAPVRNCILHDLSEKQDLQRCIDTINLIIRFLQLSKPVAQYDLIKKFAHHLNMKGKLPKSVEENCRLSHIISLWRLINVEQAKLITIGKEDPFSGVNRVFKQQLTEDHKKMLRALLGSCNTNHFLEVFYEFIVTHLINKKQSEAETELTKDNIGIRDEADLEAIPNMTGSDFSFKLKHATEIWKYACTMKDQSL